MFEEAIEYLHFAPDLRLPPLWAALKSSFWIKIDFWVITLSQTLACTWVLLYKVLVLPNGFHKNQKKVCASDGHGRYEVSMFDKNSDFYGFRPWFLDNNKHKKVKFYFFLYNSTHIFRKWKKKCFNNVLGTYICFQSSNSIQCVTFCPKRAKIRPQYLGNKLEFQEKNLPGAKCHHLVQNNWKRRKFGDITSRLCLYFWENGS